MARPQKTGLDYFPFNVDLFDDEKVIPISSEFGPKGECVVVRVLCAIYRNGYFAECSDAFKFKIANQAKVSHTLVSEVINGLVKWGFFDKSVFDSFGVITGRGIQKRWKEAVRKRIIDTKKLPYWIYEGNGENGFLAEETKFPAEETPLNRPESTQKKRKESKEKKETTNVVSQKDSTAAIAATHTRAKAFGETLIPFMELYGKDMIRAFYDYWTEPNKSQTKMRFELERTWEVGRRLATWSKNEQFKSKNNGKDKYEQKRINSEQRKFESLANVDIIRAAAEKRRKELEATGVTACLSGSDGSID